MRSEPILGDVGAVHEAGLDHPPPHEPLQSAHSEEPEQGQPEPDAHAATHEEPEHGEPEGEPDAPPEQAMHVLERENALELPERHADVEPLVLRVGAVLGEHLLPGGLAERRQDPHQRPPLNHRETRVSEAREASHKHHRCDHRANPQEPSSDGPAGPLYHVHGHSSVKGAETTSGASGMVTRKR